MNSQDFEKMDLSVGQGKNFFTMTRGSFNYKQKFSWKRRLALSRKEETENGFKLVFLDKKNCDEYEVSVNQDKAGAISVKVLDNHPSVNRWWISFPADKDERIYGCGETYSEFNLKGQKIRIWVAEHQNAKRITKKILTRKPETRKDRFSKYESYYVQPTYVSSKKFYFHANVNAFSEFDFTKPDKTVYYTQDAPEFVIENAESFEQLSKKLANRLGHLRTLPDWIYDGAILAIQQGNDVIDAKLEKAKKAGVKVVGVWSQDWCGCRRTGFGYQVMWNWQSDEEGQYPHLKEKIAEWNKNGIRLLGYINPFIAIEKNIYQEAKKNGYCVKDKDGNDYLVTITTFPAAMVDLTNPKAYEWQKELIKKNMIGIGLSGWMADFGEYLPVDCVLFDGSNPEELHNQWPAIWAKLNKEAVAECNKENEIFFFTRAGHTGTIANSAMMWTGDQHVDWSLDDGLPSVIPATLSLAMSGFPIAHSDVGGYTTIKLKGPFKPLVRSKELLMRWEEMNAFTPLFRSHEGNQPFNDVQFDDDDELLAQLKKCVDWHILLKPYLKELEAQAVADGIPVMRPLFYHYDEEKAYDENAEYLLGREMLVAPVYKKGAKKREVYLPNDKWIHAFTGKEYSGGKFEVEAPMGQPPVFIRKGSKFEKLFR